MPAVKRALFELAARTPLRRYLYYRYDYSFTPRQLAFLVRCLDQVEAVEGDVLEVGCAYGHTTVYLNKHLAVSGSRKSYFCIDTFEGFTALDVAYEESQRGKSEAGYERRYADVSIRAFRRTLANNALDDVTTVKGDIANMSLDFLGPLSFALIDVDLYLPVRAALERLYSKMAPGALIVIDDCQEHPLWDGALEAYSEFVTERGLVPEIVEGQFGILRMTKPG
ncbi:MAG: TylF/MycF/NovP-related O-methyltransferase [Acidimicrobiales bacterium]